MILAAYIRQLCAVAIAMLLLGGCQLNNGPEVIVELTYSSASNGTKLHYVNAVSGGDKFHWYGIYPDETVSITLHPGERADTKIILFYQFAVDKPKQVWEGPEFQTEQGYRMHITIYENGEIMEHSCSLPCDLNR